MAKEVKTGVMVGDIMTRSFIHVSASLNIYDCARTMIKKRVGSLLVTEGQKLKGILTEKDIIWAIVKKKNLGLHEVLAKDLMKRKIVVIKPSADLNEALRKMRKKKVRRLPVVEQKRLIGMLTLKDILKIDPGLFQMIAETMKIKEETEELSKQNIKEARKPGVCEECGEYGVLFGAAGSWVCEGCFSKL